MESSDFQAQNHFLTDQKPMMNSGLTRYQSAPSSYFSSFMDSCDEFLNGPSSPLTDGIFAGLLNADTTNNNSSSLNSIQNLCEPKQEPQVREETMMDNTRFQNYSAPSSQGFNYQSQSKPPLPDHGTGSGLDYRMVGTMGLERMGPIKVNSGNNSNLVRHSSSPAGLFSDIDIEFENGYPIVRGIGDFGTGNKDASCAVLSRQSSASGRMSPIAEMGNKMMGENSIADDGAFLEAGNHNYAMGFGTIGSWDDTTMMSAGSKGLTEQDRALSGPSETWTSDAGKPPCMLAHHLSLPKTKSAELSAVEKFLQLTDSVPCKIRAKRGCATHPRSIAERVRRTRISERMRKLQDLVPNMDKQTNTADMLDLAVDYIKDLQRQVKILSESRAKCTCAN